MLLPREESLEVEAVQSLEVEAKEGKGKVVVICCSTRSMSDRWLDIARVAV